jgi:membrane protein YqaA with SNARE-associated domain
MLRRLYDSIIGFAGHRHALPTLAAVSFVESSVFPIPPDVLMIPMCLADRRRSLWIATVCTLASVAGGFLGYAIGFYAFEAVGQAIVAFYGLEAQLQEFRDAFAEYGWWIIVIKGATPIPYKLITIASGVAQFPLGAFAVASVISRGMRFYLVAGLLWWIGEPIRRFIEERLTLVTTVSAAVLVGGFVVVRYLL